MAACHPFPPWSSSSARRRRGLKVVTSATPTSTSPLLRRLLAATLPRTPTAPSTGSSARRRTGTSKVQGLHARALDRMKVPPARCSTSATTGRRFRGRRTRRAPRLPPRATTSPGSPRTSASRDDHEPPPTSPCGSESLPVALPRCSARAAGRLPVARRRPGYAGAGPIPYAFARFVLDEIVCLRAEGRRKPFLLRDGHLLRLVTRGTSRRPRRPRRRRQPVRGLRGVVPHRGADVERHLRSPPAAAALEDPLPPAPSRLSKRPRPSPRRPRQA